MSSGTASNPTGARAMVNSLGQRMQEEGANTVAPALSPRQQSLNHLFSYFRCQNYDARRVDWAGRQHLEHVEHEMVAQSGFIPGGFYDAGQMFPLKFRRPTAPYYLGRVIVERFTSLLFSQRRHPSIIVEGDPDTQDFVNACVESGRLWSAMIMARNYGGSMGSVGLGFKIMDGTIVFEVHDPRWSTPELTDRDGGKVLTFEKRYAFPDHVRGPKGEWVEAWFWYRRVITDTTDTVWPRVPVGDGDEPLWDRHRSFETVHAFGFCPIVWMQNLSVQDELDGDPDCHGVYDIIEAIDALLAQANQGILNNCDPTLNLSTDAELDEVRKGSDNAIKLEKGGQATYLEITGTGPKSALELVEQLEERACRVARCYLDTNQQGPQRTVVEIERNYSSMIEKADLLREQYGERGVKPLLVMLLKAAGRMVQPRIERINGIPTVVKGTLNLPKKVIKEGDDGRATFVDHVLGMSRQLDLKWPSYFHPSLEDVRTAVQAAAMAKAAGLIDDEHAAQYIAQYFQIENVGAMLAKLKEQADASGDAMEAQMLARMAQEAVTVQTPAPPGAPAPGANRGGPGTPGFGRSHAKQAW